MKKNLSDGTRRKVAKTRLRKEKRKFLTQAIAKLKEAEEKNVAFNKDDLKDLQDFVKGVPVIYSRMTVVQNLREFIEVQKRLLRGTSKKKSGDESDSDPDGSDEDSSDAGSVGEMVFSDDDDDKKEEGPIVKYQSEYERAFVDFCKVIIDDDIDSELYVGFGMMNSHIYRLKFLTLVKNLGLSKDAVYHIIKLTVAVKSRQRILTHINKFEKFPWFNQVKKFFSSHTVQKTSELKRDDKFAVVHIPSCMPSVAAICFARMCRETSPVKMLENMWAAQLSLDKDCLDYQKEWEAKVWNNLDMIAKSKEKGGFNESYWNTKSADQYRLITPDHEVFKKDKPLYSIEDIEEYMDLCKKQGLVHRGA